MKVKLWTIQSMSAWDSLQSNGYLTPTFNEECIDWKSAYLWMIENMKKRIGLPESEDKFPIWAWYQYQDSKKRRPDLRRIGHLSKGVKGVRIEFVKDEEEIVLSDFILWHIPLVHKFYIGQDEQEMSDYKDKLKRDKLSNLEYDQYPNDIKQEIENSWLRVFDMDFAPPYHPFKKQNKMIQATFWRLDTFEITKVDRFTSV